jgi:hypothetical protein
MLEKPFKPHFILIMMVQINLHKYIVVVFKVIYMHVKKIF